MLCFFANFVTVSSDQTTRHMRSLPLSIFIAVIETERKGGAGCQCADDNSVTNCIMYLIPVSERRRAAALFVIDTVARVC
jgi:hypothetical protein